MRRKKCHRVICCILSLVLTLVALVKIDSSAFESKGSELEINDRADIHEINYLENESVDLFEEEVAFFEKVKQRIDTPQDDLRIVKYLMNDGTVEMRIFNDPLKYVGDNGEVHTKSMKICELSGDDAYKYSNIDNDIIMRFGSDYSKGVTAEYNGHSISFFPYNDSKAEAKFDEKSNTVFYDGVFSSNTRVEYKAQYSGLKEDIVLEKYDGVNSFSFVVYSKDRIVLDNGSIQLVDEKDVCVGDFGSVIITDAVGNKANGSAEVEMLDNGNYLYTVWIPNDYLIDVNTVYPVVIDPSFTYNQYAYAFAGYKQIYDVTLTQTGYLYQPNDSDLLVCLNPVLGYEVALIKFPNLVTTLKRIGAANITYVGYSYFSFTNSTNSVTVMPMSVNWQHTASTLSNDTYDSLFNGYYSSGHVYESLQYSRNKLDITSIALGWVNNTYSNRGIMIKGINDTDIGSAEASNANYGPYISVNYNYQPIADVDPLVGLKKLVPICANGFFSEYAMKNCDNVVMTQRTDNVYSSDQLLLISSTPYGYTIQNPYNDTYLTSDYDDVVFSTALSSSSYWSFLENGSGYYSIVGTNQEQVDCSTPSILGSSVGACLLYQGIYNKQPVSWFVMNQIDNIPFKLKNASSLKSLTLYSALDADNTNIFQYSLHTETGISAYNPIFGAQGVRVHYDQTNSCYGLYLMASVNGRFQVLSWDSSNNAFSYNPYLGNNKLSITINTTGYATIKHKTGSKLAFTVIDDYNGSGTGNTTASNGNIIFSAYNSSDAKQKWILELDIEQFKKEAYYSQFNVGYPMPNIGSDYRIVNYDYSPSHTGLDMIAYAGTALYSTITGTVVKTGFSNARGLYVVVESNTMNQYGTDSKICMVVEHLYTIYVNEEDPISAGDPVGLSGDTGNVTGAHLHYGYCTLTVFNDADSTPKDFVDPLLFHNDDELYRRPPSFDMYPMLEIS